MSTKFHRTILTTGGASGIPVKSFATQWGANQFPPIYSFVFNVALQFFGPVQYTVDGFEKTFAISHIGHALAFSFLRCHLADTARIVVVSSGTHDPAQQSGMPDAYYSSAEELAHPTEQSSQNKGRQRYSTTKLTNILYTYSLHRRFEAINQKAGKHWTVVTFDPGMMPGKGDWTRTRWFCNRKVLMGETLAEGYTSFASLDTSKHPDSGIFGSDDGSIGNGAYYEGPKRIKSSEASYDKAKQEDLWQWTVKTLADSEFDMAALDLRDLL
ncbi:hypothetical protein UA08_05974 [Talaromyces atroroseus]|uniref:Uncharacterized protein n=1 Tax=Talaromyces atroroseus TaxID=1441469 RepID=A0A225AVW6_TALAT|nr:hypothetical protein UA08_05974 [Talaromyces atroroseus]OKL58575.1 hypothetical protein UA08_05974 [Talaromyces atroroseus]